MIRLKKILNEKINSEFIKLKKPLYHGTTCNNINSIKDSGLRIGYAPVHRETSRKRIGRVAKKGIYVTNDIEGALLYAYDASKEVPPDLLDMADAKEDNMCIVKITAIPKDAKVGFDGYDALMIDKEIPPECIKILTPDELKKYFKVTNLLDVVFG